MSDKERNRRKLCTLVFREAWRFRKRTAKFIYSLSMSLKLAWATVRGFVRFRHSKVRGVSYGNRQKALKIMSMVNQELITLKFVREPYNPYDSNTIKIIADIIGKGTAMIGYLEKNQAREVCKLLDEGRQAAVFFNDITGLNKEMLGCNFSYAII